MESHNGEKEIHFYEHDLDVPADNPIVGVGMRRKEPFKRGLHMSLPHRWGS